MIRTCLTICLLLGLQNLGYAQESGNLTAPYEYVTLVTSNGGNAYLDYGQLKPLGKQAPVTEVEKDYLAVQKLWKAMLALNYLTSKGWEYVGVSSRQSSSGSTSSGSFSIDSSTEYLLRRRKQ